MLYILEESLEFPNPILARKDGLLAVGGDLSTERLLLAYQQGIFPWYNPGEEILWWSPNPRFVLFPANLKISKSMRQVLKKEIFEIRYDSAFEQVIQYCSTTPRDGQYGSWITAEMMEAYIKLHAEGWAHSVEAWKNGELVGGLYGISIGSSFFGESMFSHQSNASKAAFIHLVQNLEKRGFNLIDCQVYTEHLESLGAIEIPRTDFLSMVKQNNQNQSLRGKWTLVMKGL